MHTTIKKIIADIFYFLSLLKLCKSPDRNCFRILLYHCIGEPLKYDYLGLKVSLQNFSAQMHFLKENDYTVFSLEELICKVEAGEQIPSRSVAITFDDGYGENIRNVSDVLKKYNFTATFFIGLNYILNKIDYSKKNYWQYWDFLNKEEIRNLLVLGNTIGSHSCTHQDMLRLSLQEAESEMTESKNILQKMLSININLFSYPHGKYNEKLKQILKKNGYIAACSSILGYNRPDTDPFALKRIPIDARDTIFEFKKKLNGCYDWISYIKRYKTH
ncbi:polysaccharide deacetylase family protein [Candidatus Omnitrophota bacterium]